MSLNFMPVQPVAVIDPIMNLTGQRDYAILKGGSQVSYKQWTSTSISNTSINWSVPPPSGSVVVSRKLYCYIPMRITFTGIPPNGVTLLNGTYDAPRAFPLANILETIQMQVNNTSVSINCSDTNQALLWFNTGRQLRNTDYSLTPSEMDQSQQYADLLGFSRSPLSSYGDTDDDTVSRGGFPYVVVANPAGDGVHSVTATVDIAFCEPLFLSPLYFGMGNSAGFYNVNAMDFTLNFLSGGLIGNRVWSHINTLAGNFTSISTSFTTASAQNLLGGNVPLLIIKYITPQETMVLSPAMAISYPYYDIQRYITSFPTVNSGISQPFPSNNIQLNSIPHRIWVYVRMRNQDLQSSPNNTDTYFQISSVNIQFMNRSGLLASATPMDLYEMARRNGYVGSWTQWSGGPVQSPGAYGTNIGTVGSILCINPALDFGLDSLDANGKLSQVMLQITVQAKNIATANITPEMYVVISSEGTFTIAGLGVAMQQIGVISSKDILDAQRSAFVNYHDIVDKEGGNFFSGIIDFGRKVNNWLKDNKVISRVLGSPLGKALDVGLTSLTGVPLPVSGPLSTVAQHFGYGAGDGGELITIGGKRMSKSQLRKRLH